MKNWWLLLMLIPLTGIAEEIHIKEASIPTNPDSFKVEKQKLHFIPGPKKATRLAFIPGVGQWYNRDYWKLPLVYISMAGGKYSWHLNNLKYHDFLSAYKQFFDLDPKSKSYGQPIPGLVGTNVPVRIRNLFNTESKTLSLSQDVIARNKDYWRRNRNLSIIVTSGIYALSIIEANVAAHMKTFDLSDDLSLRMEPTVNQSMMSKPAPGVRLVFNLK